MSWAVPQWRATDKEMCSLPSLLRAESHQRELVSGSRGVSFGRELSKSYEIFYVEGGFGCDGCGYLVKQMEFSSGEH